MNDSFLEELELIPKESKKTSQKTPQQLDRHITTRHATSSPLLHFSEQDERDNVMQQEQHFTIRIPNTSDIKIIDGKESSLKTSKRQSDQNMKKHSANVKASEKTEKITDIRGKPVDTKTKIGNNNQQSVSGEHKTKLQETKYSKVPEIKDHKRRSGSVKETTYSTNTLSKENKRKTSLDSSNNNSSDTSSKENSRPSDSSKEAGPHNPTKEKEKLIDKSRRSGFKIQDQDPVVLLTAIKELISTYTKQESTRILRAMQELHINSQATLIKNLLNQTDDLIKEMHPSKDSVRMRALIEENEYLQQELMALRMRNENLQNKLEELEFLKQENATLKLKCNELAQT
ncbi:centrosomal protein of 83 kDa [Monomorium pharaonis]|uniref:centrosomal protein of 83 kDa n=1 Tax=Monomorium pharaonis TaxID=307658 RepID=UPI00063F6A45|nr:centrosomal protein of 83 kDa [Monomorium pharaonis]XP_012526369.1 centrosomal protein of 83 kDa [Monomorium pharaonis]